MSETTMSNQKQKPITLEDLKKAADYIYDKEEKPIKQKWFEKLMNKWGWHRKYQIIIFDKSKFNNNFFLDKRPEI